MHYGNGNMGYNYSMEDVLVEEVDCEKDLGVTNCCKTDFVCGIVFSEV